MCVAAGKRTYVFNIKKISNLFFSLAYSLSHSLTHSVSFCIDCHPTVHFFLTITLLFVSPPPAFTLLPTAVTYLLSLIQTNSYPRERNISKIFCFLLSYFIHEFYLYIILISNFKYLPNQH